MPSQYVNLMPEDQDFGRQRRSRPEQPDQHRPDKAAGFLHRTDSLRDSASVVSPIEFTTGTVEISCASLAVPTAIPFALFAQLILEASCPQFGAHIASNWPLAGFPVSAAVSFALLH
jgi:hypothetical protein